jgi:hypothetical protein
MALEKALDIRKSGYSDIRTKSLYDHDNRVE